MSELAALKKVQVWEVEFVGCARRLHVMAENVGEAILKARRVIEECVVPNPFDTSITREHPTDWKAATAIRVLRELHEVWL